MSRPSTIRHEFVKSVPPILAEGTIYVSIEYATAIHRCLCGCGNQVVTPLSPTDWKLIYDGDTISLNPSIGNWGFACRSHYWIERDRVKWAGQMTSAEIAAIRARDRRAKTARYDEPEIEKSPAPPVASKGVVARALRWLLGPSGR